MILENCMKRPIGRVYSTENEHILIRGNPIAVL